MITSVSRVPADFTGKEEVVVVPLLKSGGALKGAARKLDTLTRSAISDYLKKWEFGCDHGQSILVRLSQPKAPAYSASTLHAASGRAPQHLLLLGLGERDALTPERLAQAAGSASRALKDRGLKTCHLLLGDPLGRKPFDEHLHPFIRGFALAQYSFAVKAGTSSQRAGSKKSSHRAGASKGKMKLFVMSDDAGVSRAVKSTGIVTEHIQIVRDFVNAPAHTMTPSAMATEARRLANRHGVQCRVMGPREIDKLKMGAVRMVAQGSRQEPRLIVLHYNKGKAGGRRVCLVGKGVTFDSGGISIKPSLNMHEMKGDMAGGALVIGAITAAARLKLPLEIIGIVPCVENLPSGTAFRPGDVVETCSGKTIEVISTDAEGRLILSDALSYAGRFKPGLIVDFATLTGAVLIALGPRYAGVVGNSQPHIDKFLEAAKRSGEPAWQLPLDQGFSDMVKGDISDYKNYSGRDGSIITAAALLGEFVGDTPWIHLDIAGTFWSTGGAQGKGATGYGVDLTLRFLRDLASSRKLV